MVVVGASIFPSWWRTQHPKSLLVLEAIFFVICSTKATLSPLPSLLHTPTPTGSNKQEETCPSSSFPISCRPPKRYAVCELSGCSSVPSPFLFPAPQIFRRPRAHSSHSYTLNTPIPPIQQKQKDGANGKWGKGASSMSQEDFMPTHTHTQHPHPPTQQNIRTGPTASGAKAGAA